MSTQLPSNSDFMAWNSPGSGSSGNNGYQGPSGNGGNGASEPPRQDNGNPWGRQPGQENDTDPFGRTMRSRKTQNQGLNDLLNALKKLFGGGRGGANRSSGSRGHSAGTFGVGLVLVIIIGIYIFSGFYTVREAERGVVLRFGKVYDVVEPGLAWKFTGIDEVHVVDIEQVRAIQSSGSMLTEDENLVIVEMDVQYRISDPVKYLFSVTDPDNSLTEATDSALRYVVGHTLMDDILTSGREMVRQNTRDLLVSIIEPYQMGLTVVDVNFLPARAPDQVKEAFDDAIAAQEDEQRFVREAEAYANEVLPRADGQVQRIRQEAEAYRSQVVLDAEGEVARFEEVLPEYLAAPEITRKRIYLETMQQVLASSQKVIVDTDGESNNPLMYLPLPQMQQSAAPAPRENAAPVSTGANTEPAPSPAPVSSGRQTSQQDPGQSAPPLLPGSQYGNRR